MECFIKKIVDGKIDEGVHRKFIRFGKGEYEKRFLISFTKTNKVKVKASFEFANDFVEFVKENKDVEFSGKVLMKERINGKEGRKKAGSFVYEISGSSLKEFENAYYYLLDANAGDIVLKIKKSLPKPGGGKINDKFCLLEVDLKYWPKIKETFFWDLPEAKKAKIEHDIVITDIEIPKHEEDAAAMREKAVRKGKVIRKIDVNGQEIIKEIEFAA